MPRYGSNGPYVVGSFHSTTEQTAQAHNDCRTEIHHMHFRHRHQPDPRFRRIHILPPDNRLHHKRKKHFDVQPLPQETEDSKRRKKRNNRKQQ